MSTTSPIVKMPKVGVGVLVVRNGLLLLGKRIGKHMPGFYAAPGGHLEHGEWFEECARREILEETGLQADSVEFLTIGNYMFSEQHYVDVDMIAHCTKGQPQCREPEKCEGWNWYELNKLPQPLFVVTERMISAYVSGDKPKREAIGMVIAT